MMASDTDLENYRLRIGFTSDGSNLENRLDLEHAFIQA